MAIIRTGPLQTISGGSAIADMLKGAGFGFKQYGQDTLAQQQRDKLDEDRKRQIMLEDERRQVQKFNVMKTVIGQTSGYKGGELGEAYVPTPTSPSQPEGADITAGAPIDDLQKMLSRLKDGSQAQAFDTGLDFKDGNESPATEFDTGLGAPTTPAAGPSVPETQFTAPELTVRDATPITAKERVTMNVLGTEVPLQFLEERESAEAGAALRQAMAQQNIDIQTGKVHRVTAADIAGLPTDLQKVFTEGQLIAPGALTGLHVKAFEVLQANKARTAAAQDRADLWNQHNAITQRQKLEGEIRQEERADRKHDVKNEDDFLANTAEGWQDFDDTMYTSADFGKRGGINIAAAKAFAKKNKRKMVGKDLARETLQAKATLSDISRLESLLRDEQVVEWLGAYAGRVVNWESGGWLAPLGELNPLDIPKGVTEFRSTLNRLAAKERHEIYGAAVTPTEAKFAAGFIPSISQGYPTMLSNINEARDDLVRALNVGWGQMQGTFDEQGRVVHPGTEGEAQGTGGGEPQIGDEKTFPNGSVGVWDGLGYVKQ
jgi:hypothetical protein